MMHDELDTFDDGDPRGFFGELNFVHKRVLRAAVGFVTGGPLGAVGGFIGASSKPGPVPGRTGLGIAPQGPCNPGLVRGPDGVCFFPGSPGAGSAGVGASMMVSGFGDARTGRFGVALEPAVRQTVTKHCPPGAVLGKDELCYNKSDISKKNRKWNPGRPPLLTGGERNAITKAAGAARKIQRTEKQLQKLGLLKKPSHSRRRAAPPAPRGRIGSGQQIINLD